MAATPTPTTCSNQIRIIIAWWYHFKILKYSIHLNDLNEEKIMFVIKRIWTPHLPRAPIKTRGCM